MVPVHTRMRLSVMLTVLVAGVTAPGGAAPVPKKSTQQAALESAFEIAKANPDPHVRIFDLTLVAGEYLHHKDTKAADRVFEVAREHARKGPQPDHQLMFVASSLAHHGMASDAMDVLDELVTVGTGSADHHRAFFALFLRNSGALTELALLADKCAGQQKDECLGVLAAEQSRLGQIREAETTLKKINDYSARATAWAAVAVAQHQAKDTKAAKATLQAALNAFDKLDEKQKPSASQNPHSLLAVAYARIGDQDAALGLAKANGSETTGWTTVRKIALITLENGDVKQALRLADGIKDEYCSDHIRADVVNYHLSRKDIPKARDQADTLACVYWKVRAYQEIAIALADAGKPSEATAALDSAVKFAGPNADRVQNDGGYTSGLRGHTRDLMFRTRAAMGQADAAMADAEKLERPRSKMFAYINIARGLRAPLPNEEK